MRLITVLGAFGFLIMASSELSPISIEIENSSRFCEEFEKAKLSTSGEPSFNYSRLSVDARALTVIDDNNPLAT